MVFKSLNISQSFLPHFYSSSYSNHAFQAILSDVDFDSFPSLISSKALQFAIHLVHRQRKSERKLFTVHQNVRGFISVEQFLFLPNNKTNNKGSFKLLLMPQIRAQYREGSRHDVHW